MLCPVLTLHVVLSAAAGPRTAGQKNELEVRFPPPNQTGKYTDWVQVHFGPEVRFRAPLISLSWLTSSVMVSWSTLP
eukprot:1363749-Rhodomonas_salina.1